ncbi:CorA family divalent cation transporter [Pseudooceanicola algae]|uniref:Zinc transport protein ZntB n=1 Tax=Pseudooceanicola algae TaxID=1537215 RepID=A0A418SBX5_9RHOB|nr:CorA family divalent cation transporter [Pseudooceanicola algae]QPM90815.1 Zinc transport protein ZntB [Pseudooceanicola algae]
MTTEKSSDDRRADPETADADTAENLVSGDTSTPRPQHTIPEAPDGLPQDCLHCAYVLAGQDRGRALDPIGIGSDLASPVFTWAHLDDRSPGARDWLRAHLPDLEDWVIDGLTRPDAHSRATRVGGGLFIVLRSINVIAGADPLDMIALRIWVDDKAIVTLSNDPVHALDEVTHLVAHGDAPTTPGAFIAAIVRRLADQLEPVVEALEDQVDALEANVVEQPDPALRREIAARRLGVVKLRRHAPSQAEALGALLSSGSPLLLDRDLRQISENHARMRRLSENVDELRDSLVVLRDDLTGQLSDRLNRHMYILAVISGVFLPLTFVTGLLGINVEGIPGAREVDAFWFVTAGLVAFAGVLVVILRWFHWME